MTLTNPSGFLEFSKCLSRETMKNTWFFPIRQDKKTPDVPAGSVLRCNTAFRLNLYDAIQRLKRGQNVGIYAMVGGLMVLDFDVRDGKLLASQSILDAVELNPTMTIQTRNGGIQKYFQNEGKYGNQVMKENGINIGELRADWYYVLSVGSYVPPDEHSCQGDGTYRLKGTSRAISQFHGLSCCVEKTTPELSETQLFSQPAPKSVSIAEYQRKLMGSGKVRV